MSAPSPLPPLSFQQDANRAAVIFVTTAVALFACLFLLGFISKLSYLGPDEWFLGILGATLVVFDVFLIRYFKRRPLVLNESDMEINRFFRDHRIPYADLTILSAYLEKIHQPLIKGTRMPPRIVHRLLVKTKDGREILMTLPSFGFNASLIEALEKRSGMAVDRLPERESKPRW